MRRLLDELPDLEALMRAAVSYASPKIETDRWFSNDPLTWVALYLRFDPNLTFYGRWARVDGGWERTFYATQFGRVIFDWDDDYDEALAWLNAIDPAP